MKIELTSALAALRSLPRVFETYVANIPESLMDLRRAEGAWTIREHVYHLAEVQPMLGGRIRTIGESPDVKITPFIPDESRKAKVLFRSVEEALASYAGEREKQAALVETLRKESFEHSALHPEYKQYNLPILINHIVFHDYWHLYRIEEIWLLKDEFFS